jgi:hopanoid C-2 methylase
MNYTSGMIRKKRILVVNCYIDESRIPVRRKSKFPQSMTAAYLAGLFSSRHCDIKLYDELYSGPLEDERILAFPDMLVLTGLNTAFDRMLHLTAYVRTKCRKAIVVAGGSAIRALPLYAANFFDYCCTGDIEQLSKVIEDALGTAYISESFLEKRWVVPRYDLVYWTSAMDYVESSRNCYYNCSFCSLTAENGRYHTYPLEYVYEQFIALGKRRVVQFLDNNFSSFDRQFISERFSMLKDLRKDGYFKRWCAEVSSEFFQRDENLDLSSQSGCLALFSGVESFDRKSLIGFRKSQNTQQPQVEMIRNCLDAGITLLYGIVFDLTTRSIADLKAELDFVTGTPEISLPSFISLAIPLLKSPFFYQCLDQKLFLPNVKVRDMDGTTIILRPLDPISDSVQFVRAIQDLNGYRSRIIRHMKNFYSLYKKKLSWDRMALAQSNAFLLCTPTISTAASDFGRIAFNGFRKVTRTHIGSAEPLDSIYKPAFHVSSLYAHYFRPTMLTDEAGAICESLHADLLSNN